MNSILCGRRGLFGLALLALALALAGCGRRGEPDPPPGTPASQVVPPQVSGDPAQPGRKPTPANSGAQAVSGNTFPLDPLVK